MLFPIHRWKVGLQCKRHTHVHNFTWVCTLVLSLCHVAMITITTLRLCHSVIKMD